MITRSLSAAAATVAATALLLGPAAPAAADEETADRDVRLAKLGYTDGLQVDFTDSHPSAEIGMVQTGEIDRTRLIPHVDGDTFLKAYLDITPDTVPVPQRLVDDHDGDPPPELRFRRITTSAVVVDGLTPPQGRAGIMSDIPSCNYYYWSWWDWHDTGMAGMAPKTYYASWFGDKKRYSDSFVANCTPSGWASYLYARHRIYWKDVSGYHKHFDGKVTPWHWQAAWKGSVKRWRKIYYNDGWNSSPSCGQGKCIYTREGRFAND